MTSNLEPFKHSSHQRQKANFYGSDVFSIVLPAMLLIMLRSNHKFSQFGTNSNASDLN